MLFAITGIDGSGKSTQIYLLKKFLERKGHAVSISKAYGNAEKESLAHFFQYWDDLTITLIFQGLHRQQYVEAKKSLSKGKIVIADRWDETYLAYHTEFGFLSENHEIMYRLNKLAFEELIPDITFFIDTPIEAAQRRLKARGMDFFDKKSAEHHLKMRELIIEVLKGRNSIFIDGAMDINEIHLAIIKEISNYFQKINLTI